MKSLNKTITAGVIRARASLVDVQSTHQLSKEDALEVSTLVRQDLKTPK